MAETKESTELTLLRSHVGSPFKVSIAKGSERAEVFTVIVHWFTRVVAADAFCRLGLFAVKQTIQPELSRLVRQVPLPNAHFKEG
jgi:hypothetical protein